jgi:hypothetical protein
MDPIENKKKGKSEVQKQPSSSVSSKEIVNIATDAIKEVQGMTNILSDDALKVTTPNFSSELNNIDFRKLLGGPLQAAVDAQVASSLATVNFINSVGFNTDANGKKELVMVDFSHDRKDVKADGGEDKKTINIKVPLLAMLPIPSLRIEHLIVDLNIKLNSVESANTSSELGVNVTAGGGWGPVSLKVSASYKRQSSTGIKIEREYAMNVNMKAVQDEIPAGLEKILNLLSA